MNSKPNIVLIMSDDQGHWGMNCAKNKEIITPNLDKLSKNGVLFESFFCVSPVCSPARASIFTGKIPSAHGVHDWIHKGHVDYSHVSEDLKKKFSEEDLPWEYEWGKSQLKGDTGERYLDGHTTFTKILASNGYTCALSGKWHMGDSFTPQAGFTYWETIALGGDNYFYPIVLKNGEMDMERDKYITEYITDNAIKFLEKTDDEPFYLSVHYTAPHAPWDKHHHPEEFYELYNDIAYDQTPYELPHKWSGMSFESEDDYKSYRKKALQGYYAATTAMDHYIGKIIDKLEQTNKLNNTIIIFKSDNGMSMGHHGIFGKGNGTYPMNMYDSAVKVPMIISAPFMFESDVVNTDLYSHYDIFPTILDILDLNEFTPKDLPGKSFYKALKGEAMEGQGSIVIMDEYGPVRMIRNKEYKYVHRYLIDEHELYDLVNDPCEKVNLISDPEYSNIREKMHSDMENWFFKYADEKYDGKDLPVSGYGQLTAVYPRADDLTTMFIQK